MQCYGIRSAIGGASKYQESIIAATKELLNEMARANEIEVKDSLPENSG